jgi:hypothetical protein
MELWKDCDAVERHPNKVSGPSWKIASYLMWQNNRDTNS